MEPGFRTPILDFFRRGDVEHDIRLLAARGGLAARANEQLALLVLLLDDPDPEVAAVAADTLDAIPPEPLAAFLARSDAPTDLRAFFKTRGIEPAETPAPDSTEPLVDTEPELPAAPVAKSEDAPKMISLLSVPDRLKLAMKGSREQRAVLVRDSNKMVSVSVLSSPKLTETEVESFARMANVSEEVLRIIGTTRAWVKNYSVVSALTRNPKTPPAISLQLVSRLTERDVKMLSTDRNVPEPLRVAARKFLRTGQARRQ